MTDDTKIKYQIKNRFTGAIQFECELGAAFEKSSEGIKLGAAVKLAFKARANLADANLARANLADAYLADANLARADLARADLADAYLARADLARANLADAYLARADLAGANLARANLAGANLARADLADANLAGAYLAGANLARANLAGAYLARADLADANLAGAYLAGANLAGAKNAELAAAMTVVAPREGEIIGWKKCRDGVIVKLRIPAEARRSNATSRKCRAEFVEVIEVVGAEIGISEHDQNVKYKAGERVACHEWDDDRWSECSGGIHFFITKEEAEAWSL